MAKKDSGYLFCVAAAVAVLALWAALAWAAEKDGKKAMPETTTAEWVCATYPERVDKLFEQLDLDAPGPLNNDSDRVDNRGRVLEAAETYGRPDWAYIASNGAKGRQPDYGPWVMFPWAGQPVIRSGWDAAVLWAFFDIGS
mgnify:CR=1 FL=1